MTLGMWIIILLCGMGIFVCAAILLGLPVSGTSAPRSGVRAHMRNIVSAQRDATDERRRSGVQKKKPNVYDAASQVPERRVMSSKLTLDKRLRYAQWKIPPITFRGMEIVISALAFYLASLKLNLIMTFMALLIGPIFMRWLLTLFVERRFKRFDEDYPQFLLSLVGLLKTGMNTMTAIEAAAQGLSEESLVRQEAELMMERLRYGVPEDKSIGSFGEDIFHPEIELFVQALLLSRRVGGILSDTLDRLAKQVRKRQYFRGSANAAVGMQRGSIWFIIAIMVGMEVYLYFVYPQAVVDAIKDELGWQVWQFGISVILLGIFWVRQVTKIRI